MKNVVLPLLQRCTDKALILKDVSLMVIARQLGSWLDSLKEIITISEKNWFLETYCRIVNTSWTTTTNNNEKTTTTTDTIITNAVIDGKNIISKSCITTATSILYISCKRCVLILFFIIFF